MANASNKPPIRHKRLIESKHLLEQNIRNIELTDEFTHIIASINDGENLLVTGKAGTGKSTLLMLIQDELKDKSFVVAAPTGVAALNVSGLTIHRLFAFRKELNSNLDGYKPPAFIKDLQVLIIDEISMVRADLLDMVNEALKKGKKSRSPFGGVQVIFFGDLYQLPPVLTEDEEEIFFEEYSSSYFFASKAFKSTKLRKIELSRVFRQTQEDFIKLLNAIRDGSATENEITLLNKKCFWGGIASYPETAITLCNTNSDADKINSKRLTELNSEIFTVEGKTEGEVRNDDRKTEFILKLAVGARIMMLVNSEPYVNGSLGQIEKISFDENEPRVTVKLDDYKNPIDVYPHTWEIYKPSLENGKVEKSVVGTFTQLPLRLSWAVTVHKSQGQTFKEVVYDRGRGTFAKGQLYVALSRCTSIEGLILHKAITLRDVKVDNSISDFFESQSISTRKLGETDWTLVSFISTGGMEFDKCVEISIQNTKSNNLSFSTLINPERDLTRAIESGISATELSLAPRLVQVESILRLVFDNKVIVSRSFNKLRDLMKLDDAVFAWGIGYSILEERESRDHGSRAKGLLTQDLGLLDKYLNSGVSVKEAKNRRFSIEPGSYYLAGEDFPYKDFLKEFCPSLDEVNRARLIAASLFRENGISRDDVDGLRVQYKVGTDSIVVAAQEVLNSLTVNASSNGEISEYEKQRIHKYGGQFGLQVEIEIKQASKIQLHSNMTVCLTGAPPSEEEFTHLMKPQLTKALLAKGLVEVGSVTKKCDLVVAYNKESLSGKAKKARDVGIPVISSEEFVELLKQM